MICGSGGSKSRLAKAVGAEPPGQMRWKIARTFWSQNVQTQHHSRTTFGSSEVEEWHAAVVRSTFWSQKVFIKDTRVGPLWHQAHFQVKMLKTWGSRAISGGARVEKWHAVVARSTFRSEYDKTPAFRNSFGGSDVEQVTDRWDR